MKRGKRKTAETRREAVRQTERTLKLYGWPRLQMSLILLLTGFAGFLFSVFLLDAGLWRMWLRYPAMVLFAYGVFLLLLRAWIFVQQRGGFGFDEMAFEDLGEGHYYELSLPKGGSGGGGWGFSSSRGGGGGGSWLGNFGFDLNFDDDGCAVLLALIALVAAITGALVLSVYIIFAAPTLLAEILVDALLLAGLYKRVKSIERKHWARSALRKTWLPLLSVLVLFTLAGYAMQRAVPEARTIGEFWRRVTGS